MQTAEQTAEQRWGIANRWATTPTALVLYEDGMMAGCRFVGCRFMDTIDDPLAAANGQGQVDSRGSRGGR